MIEPRQIHPSMLPEQTLLSACDVVRTRRSGPGGQHRNKVQTAIVLTHRPSGVRVEASERRSQRENLAAAVFRMRLRLAVQIRTEARPISDLWRGRAAGGTVAVNPHHADFPALLAEALDHLAALDWNTSAAARTLGVSHTQFVRFFRLNPAAHEKVNAHRAERGLPPLR